MVKEEKSTWLKEIVVSLATAGLIGLFSLIPGGWAWLFGIPGAIWGHLGRSSAMPNWSIYLLGATAVFACGFVIWAAFRAAAPEWKAYVEDNFHGVRWRWRYSSATSPDPWAYCPTCDTMLVYTQQGNRFSPEPTIVTLFCERCDVKHLEHEGDKNYLVAAIRRQIDRNIRTGDWRKRA